MKIELNFIFFNFNNNYFATQIKLIFCLNFFKTYLKKNIIRIRLKQPHIAVSEMRKRIQITHSSLARMIFLMPVGLYIRYR